MAQSGAYRPPDYLLNSTLTYSLTLSSLHVVDYYYCMMRTKWQVLTSHA